MTTTSISLDDSRRGTGIVRLSTRIRRKLDHISPDVRDVTVNLEDGDTLTFTRNPRPGTWTGRALHAPNPAETLDLNAPGVTESQIRILITRERRNHKEGIDVR